MKVIINPAYEWLEKNFGEEKAYYKGRDGLSLAEKIKSALNIEDIKKVLSESNAFSGGILTDGGRVVAWADHIRSYPLFYTDSLVLTNDARSALNACQDPQQDEGSLVDFSLAGFIGGPDTLYKNVKCLEPGSFLVWKKSDASLQIYRYFQYSPAPNEDSFEKNIEKISLIIDEVVRGIIERAGGRPIYVPLSAGLDSRIILCKLHEHGYKNLHAFTYGPRFNFEAMHAKNIAKKLNVPWRFVHTPRAFCQKLFLSDERRSFTRFADGLKTIPCMREFAALKILKQQASIPSDAIMINGQSGDYISGGHVDDFWYSAVAANENDFMQIITKKHYDLWAGLKDGQTMDVAHQRIKNLVPAFSQATYPMDFAACGETWEYDARQIVYVVNGQRAYEFFGYDWELPLWEKSLVDFFSTVPYEQKRGQALFKAYLKRYNYCGLFPQKEPHIWRWPVFMLWVLPLGKMIELVSSKERKEKFYSFMRYFGHYSNQYAFFPFSLHVKTASVARNVVSLFGRQWFVENEGYALPEKIRRAMRIGKKGFFKL